MDSYWPNHSIGNEVLYTNWDSLPRYPFFGEGSPTKIDHRKKGTCILTSLLEDLVADAKSTCSSFSASDRTPVAPELNRCPEKARGTHAWTTHGQFSEDERKLAIFCVVSVFVAVCFVRLWNECFIADAVWIPQIGFIQVFSTQ